MKINKKADQYLEKTLLQGSRGLLKVAVELLTLQSETAKGAKCAKFFDFLGELRGSKLWPGITLRKH